MSLGIDSSELLRRILDSRVQDIWTNFPAKVLSYDAAKQTVEIQPMIRRPIPSGEDGDIENEEPPVLPDVPVMFPRSAGVAITWPITEGDFVLVLVCVSAIGHWRRTGELSDPGDLRTHHPNSCFAVPGIAPSANLLDQASINALVLDAPEIRLIKDATDFVGLASKIEQNLDAIKIALANASNSGGPVVYGTPYTTVIPVGATKVKAK